MNIDNLHWLDYCHIINKYNQYWLYLEYVDMSSNACHVYTYPIVYVRSSFNFLIIFWYILIINLFWYNQSKYNVAFINNHYLPSQTYLICTIIRFQYSNVTYKIAIKLLLTIVFYFILITCVSHAKSCLDSSMLIYVFYMFTLKHIYTNLYCIWFMRLRYHQKQWQTAYIIYSSY